MRAIPLFGAVAVIVSGCSEQTFEHTFLSASAVSVGDSLRFAVTGVDINGYRVETTTLRPGEAPAPLTTVTVDGAPLRSASAQLAAIGDHAYLMWTVDGGTSHRGAPLHDDGTIDANTIVDLGATSGTLDVDEIDLRRVGDRYLVLHMPAKGFVLPMSGVLRGTWILPDGRLDGTVEIGDIDSATAATTNDAEGAAKLWAMTFSSDLLFGGHDLRVARVRADGTVLDGAGIELASPSETDRIGPGARSIATTSDGGVLVIYERSGTAATEIHAARIAPDAAGGELTDRIIALPEVPQLVVRGTQILALSGHGGVEARVLDVDGTPLGGPVAAGTTSDPRSPIVLPVIATHDGFAIVELDGDMRVTALAPDGSITGDTVVATAYRVTAD
jgi:hypothetical protein